MTKPVYIPPKAMLKSVLGYQYQLMLPQHMDDEDYRNLYEYLGEKDRHIILDNGANEGCQVTGEELVRISQEIAIKEVVMPDEMGNFDKTTDMAEDFVTHHKARLREGVKLGYVLHGDNAHDAMRNYVKLCQWPIMEAIDIIYIPRMLVTLSTPDARIRVANFIAYNHPDLGPLNVKRPIHFLGAAPSYLEESKELAWKPGLVRSMDTSAPYVYALAGLFVTCGQAIHRQVETYYEAHCSSHVQDLANQNLKTMNRWISAQTPVGEL